MWGALAENIGGAGGGSGTGAMPGAGDAAAGAGTSELASSSEISGVLEGDGKKKKKKKKSGWADMSGGSKEGSGGKRADVSVNKGMSGIGNR